MHRLLIAAIGVLGVVTARAAACAELPPRIVMMWQVTGNNYAQDFPELKRLGVNVAQSFSLATMDPSYVDGYLEAAQSAGIGVVVFVGRFVEGSDADCRISEAGESFIRARSASPALLAWHTTDEAASHGITKACQVRLYQQVKALDPDHPVMVSLNFTQQKDYDAYFDERAFDFLDLHRYVNTDVNQSQQRLIDLFRKNRKRDYRVIVTLRAFNTPSRVKRQNMRAGGLSSQYEYFFRTNKIGNDVGFYGWRLAPHLGISQLDSLRTEFEGLAREKLVEAPASTQ